ncbi:MAG: Acetophenone carboxylase alpha subunit [Syntrophus sp. PtaU1.Bin005]|jgi:N-methylhydantoinase A/oxoprolinase/acetone carboxylase beta subunit|uniref:hydantoinase/oxoprolinase family protein n=1 Tax=Syntrophus TaxID=43773 RepID=UPI0009D47936|nr:MAG: Acetophenone carboxylase alpha subunit [Syntrophus sp. PtaB.Bin138]OPY80593.1 MAG: Acetophenone carboxylase alpha subunit [Syntrophus sp. PtaU1.Bin005]
MILGIDVGGTHTDAALIDSGRIRKTAKVATNPGHVVESLSGIASEVLKGEPLENLQRIVLSTTLSTNAIVQNKVDPVGLMVISGPGLPPSYISTAENTHFLSGYVNHRGIETAPIDPVAVTRISDDFRKRGLNHAGIIGKFSTRNPIQELQIEKIVSSGMKHVSLGHRMSGHLNFPRRVATTYLNEAIWELYSSFVKQVVDFFRTMGVSVPIYILKADGGTFNIEQSVEFPVYTILSGPAASIMGILSMTENSGEDAIALDIGGTTTDIALFADGVPLLEPFGVTMEGHKTLIRGLRSKPLGIGGDSRVRYEGGQLLIGPQREGPAAAFGGPCPTPTDAMIHLGLTDIGDPSKAEKALQGVADAMGCTVQKAAEAIFEGSCQIIARHVRAVIEEINNKPVYTIHELLEGKRISPKILYIIGGPAKPMSTRLGQLLECPVHIPPHPEIANAVGAALARTTAELTILADTERGTMTIGEEGISKKLPPRFSKGDAIEAGRELLKERALRMGAREEDLEIEVIEDQEFNMVRDFYLAGKNIRVKLQVKPGLIAGFSTGELS